VPLPVLILRVPLAPGRLRTFPAVRLQSSSLRIPVIEVLRRKTSSASRASSFAHESQHGYRPRHVRGQQAYESLLPAGSFWTQRSSAHRIVLTRQIPEHGPRSRDTGALRPSPSHVCRTDEARQRNNLCQPSEGPL
jgi:hypothetical protein